MNPIATLRNIRANLFGKRDGKALSRKHASLSYLTVPLFPRELAERYRRRLEAHLHWYQVKRAKLEDKLLQVRHLRQSLEKVLGQDEPTPEVFGHILGIWGRYTLLGLIFGAEMIFNKLAADTMGVNQLEAYVIAFIATLIMFWMGHEAGNQFRKGNVILAPILLLLPLLMAIFFATLRMDFTQRMTQIMGAPPPSRWTLPSLMALGIGLVAFTFFLGFKSPHEREILLRRYLITRNREKRLMGMLVALHRRAIRGQDYYLARYREEVAAYWRGFAWTWPNWDPAPEFVGALPPLEAPRLPPEPPGPETLEEPAKMAP